jgi:DNA-binding transcriptional ArsR family regulator
VTNQRPGESGAREADRVEILRALADPARLRIVATLGDNQYHPSTIEEYGLDIHKSTLSHHLKALREAGITSTVITGRHHDVRLQRDALEDRFPGLIDAVIAASAEAPPKKRS